MAELPRAFPVGNEMQGKIVRMLDRGVVVELGNDVEGFVPLNQLGKKDLEKPDEAFKDGRHPQPASVIEFDPTNRRIVLSVDAYYKDRDRAEFEAYLAAHPTVVAPISETASVKKEAAEAEAEAEGEIPEPEEQRGRDVCRGGQLRGRCLPRAGRCRRSGRGWGSGSGGGQCCSNDVSMLKNNGDGTFAAAVNYAAGAVPIRLCGRSGRRWGSGSGGGQCRGNNVSVLKNNGDGTFAARGQLRGGL